MNDLTSWAFWKAALTRAVRTFAQAAVGCLGTTAMITEVNVGVVLGTAAMAAVVSILNAIGTGLPEV